VTRSSIRNLFAIACLSLRDNSTGVDTQAEVRRSAGAIMKTDHQYMEDHPMGQ
jgi:hypothetical protein